MPQCVQEASTQGLQHLDARFTESIQVKAFPFSLNDLGVREIFLNKTSVSECACPFVRDSKLGNSIFPHQGRDCFKETFTAEVSHGCYSHESGKHTDSNSKPYRGCHLGSQSGYPFNYFNRANNVPSCNIEKVPLSIGGVHKVRPPVRMERAWVGICRLFSTSWALPNHFSGQSVPLENINSKDRSSASCTGLFSIQMET